MKILSPLDSEEIWLHPRYVIARFMKSKIAFKMLDDSGKGLVTAKFVQEKNLPKELQLHIRLDGKDFWNNSEDVLDVDVYIDGKKLGELLELLKQNIKS